MKSVADSMTEMEENIYKLKMERMRYLMALKTIRRLVELNTFDEIKDIVDFALQDKKEVK